MFAQSVRVFTLASLLLLIACGTNPDNGSTRSKTAQVSEQTDASEALSVSLSSYLNNDDNIHYLLDLHAAFTQGVRQVLPDRSAPFAYEQNMTRIRLQALEQESINHLFPFGNGQLRLSDLGSVNGLDIFSTQCGFASDSTDLVLRYTCLSKHDGLLRYLEERAAGNTFMIDFAKSYRREGSISEALKKQMIFGGSEAFDFTNPDHQLVYALFQLLVVEEMDARKIFLGQTQR